MHATIRLSIDFLGEQNHGGLYQKMYAILCGAVDDALMGLEQGSSAACIALRLRLALERAEEIYLETSMCAERRGDTNLIELRRDAPDVWEQ